MKYLFTIRNGRSSFMACTPFVETTNQSLSVTEFAGRDASIYISKYGTYYLGQLISVYIRCGEHGTIVHLYVKCLSTTYLMHSVQQHSVGVTLCVLMHCCNVDCIVLGGWRQDEKCPENTDAYLMNITKNGNNK